LPYPDVPLQPIGPVGPIGHLEPIVEVSPIAEIHELGTLARTLREGDTLTGQMVRAGTGSATVRLGDQQFEVAVRDAFRAGEPVTARAVVVDGRLTLRLRRGQTGSAAGRGGESAETVIAHLRALGIEPSATALLAARTMRAVGLGLDPRVLDALVRLLSGHGAFSGELAALAEALERYAARADAADRASAEQVAAGLGRLLLAADDPDLAEKLSRLARDMGLMAESRLRAAAEQGKPPTELLADDLKWALLRLRSRLQVTLAGGDSGAETVLAQLERTIAMIDAHQVEDVHGQQNGYFMLELPMQPETGFEGARVRFFYRRGRAGDPAVDVNNCTALIDVKMSRLGQIKALLTVVRGTLSCQIMSSRSDVTKLLTAESGGLRSALGALPFRLADVACITTDTDDDADGADMFLDSEPWSPGIDLSG
jgi:hypothetical protein